MGSMLEGVFWVNLREFLGSFLGSLWGDFCGIFVAFGAFRRTFWCLRVFCRHFGGHLYGALGDIFRVLRPLLGVVKLLYMLSVGFSALLDFFSECV